MRRLLTLSKSLPKTNSNSFWKLCPYQYCPWTKLQGTLWYLTCFNFHKPEAPKSTYLPAEVMLTTNTPQREGRGKPRKVTERSSSAKRDEDTGEGPKSHTTAAHSCPQTEVANPYASHPRMQHVTPFFDSKFDLGNHHNPPNTGSKCCIPCKSSNSTRICPCHSAFHHLLWLTIRPAVPPGQLSLLPFPPMKGQSTAVHSPRRELTATYLNL